MAFLFAQIGCESASGPPLTFDAAATRGTVEGDWDDLDASVIVGAEKLEWVISRWWWSDERTRNYEFRNALGTAAKLRVHRTTDEPGGPFAMTASVGPYGDAAAERYLIASIERRFAQLRGVDAAEIK